MDQMMPGMNGSQALGHMCRHYERKYGKSMTESGIVFHIFTADTSFTPDVKECGCEVPVQYKPLNMTVMRRLLGIVK